MNDIYEKIVFYRKKGIDLIIVTATEKMDAGPVEVGKKMLITATGESFGTVGGGALEHYAREKCKELFITRKHLTEKYLLDEKQVIVDAKTLPMVCGGTVTLFYEFIGVKNYIYIFGAGHVGQAVANVLKPLDFHLSIIDEREKVINAFQGGDIVINKQFVDYIEDEGVKEGSFVIVCTPSHKNDYHVINKIIELNLKPKYIGMLCSVDKIKQYLSQTYEKFGKNINLSTFYSPIGLNLGGGSPEEIAISIVSEILAIHHQKKGHKHMREDIDDNNHYWENESSKNNNN